MTVTNPSNMTEFTGNGSTTVFPFLWNFTLNSDIQVIQRDTDNIETTLTLTTHYTLTGAGGANGGSVTLLTALPTDYVLVVKRVLPLTQTTSIRNADAYFAELHEKAFDRLVQIDQQQEETISRCMKVSDSFVDVDVELPAPEAGKGLFWNGTEDALVNSAAGSVSNLELIQFYQDGADAVIRTAMDKARETVSLADYDTVQHAFDALPNGGTILVPGSYTFKNITCSAPVSLKGYGPSVSKIICEETGITFDQDGIEDKDRREWLTIEGLTLEATNETDTGLYLDNVLCVAIRDCFFRGFKSGIGLHVKDALWAYLENINTDESEVRLISELVPHYNNQIVIRGGELRNASTYALYVKNCDVLNISDLTVEGDGGDPDTPLNSPDHSVYLENVACFRMNGVYAEINRGSHSVVRMVSCRCFEMTGCYIGSGSLTVPEIWMTDCVEGTIRDSQFNWHPMVVDGDSYGVEFKHCRFAQGSIDIAAGCGVTFRSCGPASIVGADQPILIPVDPQLQEETYIGKGILLKNWHENSSFEARDPTLDVATASTVTATWDTTVGYHDDYSLKVVASEPNQRLVFTNAGTTDTDSAGAIISFMAKADSEAIDIYMQPSIFSTLGTAYTKITTEWKRYFLFSKLGTRVAGTGINFILEMLAAGTIWIDDIQTVSYATFGEALNAFDHFRYVPTHGTRITAKQNLNQDNYKRYFDRGISLRKTTLPPTGLVAGDIQYADGTTWNPATTGEGLALYGGAAWYGIPRQLGGSVSWTPGAILDGAQVTKTCTVTGAALGDFADASFSATIAGCIKSAEVTSSNLVTVTLQNETGTTQTFGALTLRCRVTKA